MKPTRVNLVQGSQEWLAYRREHLNASDAASMLGISKYKSRDELVAESSTGIVKEYDAATMARFETGHANEASARLIAMEMLDIDLLPRVYHSEIDGLELSASYDGISHDLSIVWEHKSINKDLRAALGHGEGAIPSTYHPQMEQQLMIVGAEKCLFMASDGTKEDMVWQWYYSDPEVRKRLLRGWAQFILDVEAYHPEEILEKVTAAPVMALPALSIQVQGSVSLISNLETFGGKLRDYVDQLVMKPETDQEFADGEAAVKTLESAEKALKAAEDSALAQTASVDEMRKTVAMLLKIASTARLALNRAITDNKKAVRENAVIRAGQEYRDYVLKLEDGLGGAWMPRDKPDFGAEIKGLKTVESMNKALSNALAKAKIQAREISDLISANWKSVGSEDWSLFPDFGSICTKSEEDFAAAYAVRKQARKDADEKRIEADRARIRAEEAAKVQAEADAIARAKAETERLAALEKDKAEQAAMRQEAVKVDPPTSMSTPMPVGLPAKVSPEAAHDIMCDNLDLIRIFLESRSPTMRVGELNTLRAYLVEFCKVLALAGRLK